MDGIAIFTETHDAARRAFEVLQECGLVCIDQEAAGHATMAIIRSEMFDLLLTLGVVVPAVVLPAEAPSVKPVPLDPDWNRVTCVEATHAPTT